MSVLSLSEPPEPITLRVKVVQRMSAGTGYTQGVSAARLEWQVLSNARGFLILKYRCLSTMLACVDLMEFVSKLGSIFCLSTNKTQRAFMYM